MLKCSFSLSVRDFSLLWFLQDSKTTERDVSLREQSGKFLQLKKLTIHKNLD